MEEEYLVELRESHRYNKRSSGVDLITVGDIVLIHSENKPRGFWKLAQVEELITGKDGLVRAATICVGRSTILRCPLPRIYPLEINSERIPVTEENRITEENHITEIPIAEENRVTETPIAEEMPTIEGVLADCTNTTESWPRRRRTAAQEARDKILAHAISD